MVINKPHGQKSHPNRLDETNTALNDVATYLAPMEQTPYVTHRLDMLTSGLLLIGKNPVVVPLLNRQLVQKTMQRFYLARVNLLPNNKANLTLNKSNYIETPIGQDISDKRKRAIKETGLSAQTTYRVLKIDAKQQTALLHLSLATGRTHQIRVHLASIGSRFVATRCTIHWCHPLWRSRLAELNFRRINCTFENRCPMSL